MSGKLQDFCFTGHIFAFPRTGSPWEEGVDLVPLRASNKNEVLSLDVPSSLTASESLFAKHCNSWSSLSVPVPQYKDAATIRLLASEMPFCDERRYHIVQHLFFYRERKANARLTFLTWRYVKYSVGVSKTRIFDPVD